tara:strand:+ start:297 stop:929 length:633 start_codon:yes stop_codon:yes gene_type:complete
MRTLFFVLSLVIVLAVAIDSRANNTQTNDSGSNTLIDGNMTTNNTYSGGQTNTTNSTSTNTSTASQIPVASANSPSYSSMSQDVCSMGVSGSVSSTFVGISGGKHVYDEECIRFKTVKLLMDLKMNVPAITVLCQKKDVFIAFMEADTPCPFQGVIGPEAKALWEKYPKLRPDYEEYMARLEYMAEVDIKILKEKADNDPFNNTIINVHK